VRRYECNDASSSITTREGTLVFPCPCHLVHEGNPHLFLLTCKSLIIHIALLWPERVCPLSSLCWTIRSCPIIQCCGYSSLNHCMPTSRSNHASYMDEFQETNLPSIKLCCSETIVSKSWAIAGGSNPGFTKWSLHSMFPLSKSKGIARLVKTYSLTMVPHLFHSIA